MKNRFAQICAQVTPRCEVNLTLDRVPTTEEIQRMINEAKALGVHFSGHGKHYLLRQIMTDKGENILGKSS